MIGVFKSGGDPFHFDQFDIRRKQIKVDDRGIGLARFIRRVDFAVAGRAAIAVDRPREYPVSQRRERAAQAQQQCGWLAAAGVRAAGAAVQEPGADAA